MNCQECGRPWPEGAAFCPNCGRKKQEVGRGACPNCGQGLTQEVTFCPSCGKPLQEDVSLAKQPARESSFSQGFSPRYQDPEILEAARAQRSSARGCLWMLAWPPLLFFSLAGLLIEGYPLGEGLIIGTAVALLMIVIHIFALKSSNKPVWEGVVIDRYSKEKRRHDRKTGGSIRHWELNTVIRKDRGEKITLSERSGEGHLYDYLAVGDRIRFHPAFGTYEKYDKTKDTYLYCNVCRMLNPMERERCKRCNQYLFK